MRRHKPKYQADDTLREGDLEAAARKEVAPDFKPDNHVSRREVLKGTAVAAVAAQLLLGEALAQKGGRRGGRAVARPRFFTAPEFALLDELTEMIIPADEHSPGARAAGVAAYLDRRIAETDPRIAEHARERKTWREGLRMVDRIAREMCGKGFMGGTGEQRLAVLTRMAEQEPRPTPAREPIPSRPEEQPQQQPQAKQIEATSARSEFFAFLKAQTARAYYTSQIGLHRELEYKGNRYLKEFVGYDVDGNYTGPPKSK